MLAARRSRFSGLSQHAPNWEPKAVLNGAIFRNDQLENENCFNNNLDFGSTCGAYSRIRYNRILSCFFFFFALLLFSFDRFCFSYSCLSVFISKFLLSFYDFSVA